MKIALSKNSQQNKSHFKSEIKDKLSDMKMSNANLRRYLKLEIQVFQKVIICC